MNALRLNKIKKEKSPIEGTRNKDLLDLTLRNPSTSKLLYMDIQL